MPKTDELVPQAALDELKALDAQLAKSAARMREVFTEANNIRSALSNAALSYKDLVAAISQCETVQKQAASTEREAKKAMTEREKLQNRIKNLETAEGKEVQKLRMELQQLTTATKNEIKEQQAAAGSLNEMTARLAALRKEYDALSGTVRGSSVGKAMAKEIKDLHTQVLSIEQATGRSQRNVGNYLGSFTKAGLKFFGWATAAQMGVSALKNAAKTIADFDTAQSGLAASLETTKAGVEGLAQEAIKLSSETRYAATEIVALQTALAYRGFNQQEIKNSTKDILLFAQAMGSGLGEAAELAASAMAIFGAESSETGRYVSAMAAASVKTAMDFSFLDNALTDAAVTAKAYGMSIEDVLALLGTLSDAGFSASSAGTAVRNILLNLADANGELAKRLGGNVKTLPELVAGLIRLREEGVDLAEALKLTDARSVTAFNSFMSMAESVLELRDGITGANDAMQKMATEMDNNVAGEIARIKSAWDALILSFRNAAGPIKTALSFVTTLLNRITFLLDKLRGKSAEELTTKADEARIKIRDAAKETENLVAAYEELKSKTERTADEQEELERVTKDLSGMFPSLAGELAQYGGTAVVTTGQLQALITQMRQLGAQKSYDEAVKANAKALKEIDKEYRKHNWAFNKDVGFWEWAWGAAKSIVPKTLDIIEYTYGDDAKRKAMDDYMAGLRPAYEKIKEQRDELLKEEEILEKGLGAWMEYMDAKIKKEEELNDVRTEGAEGTEGGGGGGGGGGDDGKSAEREAERERKRREDAERKAAQDLAVFRIQTEADAEKRIADDRNQAFEERKKALANYYTAQAEAVILAAENQLNSDELTASQRELIQQKLMAELKKLEYNYVKDATDLDNDRVEAAEEAAQRRIKIQEKLFRSTERGISADETSEIGDLTAEYAACRVTHEEYEKQKAEITGRYAKVRMDAETEHIRSLMGLAGLSADQQEQLSQKLADAEIKYEQYVAEQKIAIDLKAAKQREEIERELAEKRKELIGEALSVIDTMVSAQFERRLNEIDEEQEAVEKSAEDEIKRVEEQEEAGVISKEQADAQKALIEYNAQLRNDILEEKRKQTLERQAKYEKASAVAGIALNTAFAIMAQLASTPLPLGAPLVALIIAMGALQTAAALAQPVPEYARGTADHPGGLAVVGDGGRREIGILPDGRRFLTPDRPTLMDLPPHTGILPDAARVLGMEAARLNGRIEAQAVIVEMNAKPLEEGQNATNERLDAITRHIRKIRLNARYASRMSRLDRTIHLKKNLS